MCGIVGILHRQTSAKPDMQLVRRMRDSIAYRGPDDQGEYTNGPLGFGFRRLSIIDLTSGAQPMSTPDGQYSIIFNGEIYNYQELRPALSKKYHFRTQSDTEVLLYHLIEHGPAGLSQLNGMFAAALWDAKRQELLLVRDRFGKKPLYYTEDAGRFLFASELKALLLGLPAKPAIDRRALVRYLLFEYIPGDDTPFVGIKKLTPGSWLRISRQGTEQQLWWQVYPTPKDYDQPIRDPAREFDRLLSAAVRARMVADVPVGVLLSGGIDSSTIAWYMRQQVPEVHSFSVGFADQSFDESEYAEQAAKALGMQHHAIRFTTETFSQTLATMQERMDEPLADVSFLPTYAVSAEAKRWVSVVLDGDGADELLYGYNTFPASQLAQLYQKAPAALRQGVATLIQALPTRHTYFSLDFRLKSLLRGLPFPPEIRNQVWIGSFHDQELRSLLTPSWHDNIDSIYQPIIDFTQQLQNLSPLERLSRVYLAQYLQGDILQKIDRATMYASLEARTPFLDPMLVSFILQLPQTEKYAWPRGKRLLRQVMSERIPSAILNRKKQGFGIPLGRWLQGPLKELMLTTLAPAKLQSVGMINADAVARLIQEHLSNQADHRKKLWTLMVLHWWWERWAS